MRQTNDESELIGWLHDAQDEGAAVVLNPAAFTHYSYALRDACAMLTTPLDRGAHLQPGGTRGVPPHVGRGRRRHRDDRGFGIDSYRLALRAVATLLAA